jgi:hypothetical protein
MLKGLALIAAIFPFTGLGNPSIQESKGPDVSGTWTITVKAQGAHGDTTAELVLQQERRSVTGTLRAHGNQHDLKGELAGRELTLATTGGSQQQLSLTATLLDDGTLDGHISGPMGDLRWTATRAGSRK